MEKFSKKKPRWFKYVGPESKIIKELPENVLFKRKDGFFVSEREEVLIKVTPENTDFFEPTIKCVQHD
jgi:hypothetical protein